MIKTFSASALLLLFLLGILPGCSRNVDVDTTVYSSGPLRLSEAEDLKDCVRNVPDAIPTIKACRDAIRESSSTGNTSEAHRPLQVIGTLLNHLIMVTHKGGMDDKEKKATLETVARLNMLFGEVHIKFDEGQGLNYAPVSDDIDATITDLEKLFPGY